MYIMNKKCPVYTTMNFMGKKWTVLILLELYKGKGRWKRYSQLKNSLLDITPKVLSMRLRELEKQGLVKHRVDSKSFPVKSKYALSQSGEDFIKVVKGIKRWGLRWKVKNEECESMNCRECEF